METKENPVVQTVGFEKVVGEIEGSKEIELDVKTEKKKRRKKKKVIEPDLTFEVPENILSQLFMSLSELEAKILKDRKWVWTREQAGEFTKYFNVWVNDYLPEFLKEKPALAGMLFVLVSIHLTNAFKPSVKGTDTSILHNETEKNNEFPILQG